MKRSSARRSDRDEYRRDGRSDGRDQSNDGYERRGDGYERRGDGQRRDGATDNVDREYKRSKRQDTKDAPIVEIHPALLSLDAPIVTLHHTTKANEKKAQQQAKQLALKKERLLKQIQLQQEELLKIPEVETLLVPAVNPYYNPKEIYGLPAGFKIRRSKEIKSAPQGKYIEIAAQERKKAYFEKLRQQIAETAIETGLNVELDLVSDLAISTQPPPAIEWWDTALVNNGDYDDIILLNDDHPLLTDLIQHPIPIEPTHEPPPPGPRPIMLTKKEQKKMRRQNRLEKQSEKRDKVALGLLPPEQPKVKISNLMKVLGDEAILDPTQIEQNVRRDMKARVEAGKQHNLDNKLTDDQRRAKKMAKACEDETAGVAALVFRVNDFHDKGHQFKVDMNAKQLNLTGLAVVYPQLNIIVVEGGPKACKKFKRLMQHRIDWSISGSECLLVWEGTIEKRVFDRFYLNFINLEAKAKALFDKAGVPHYWNAAKNYETGL